MDSERKPAWVDVFIQRDVDSADRHDGGRLETGRLEGCLDLHGIVRERSYLAPDGSRILCHFRAPDAESLRTALRVARIDYAALWTGAVALGPASMEHVLVVEQAFEQPLGEEEERRCRARVTPRLRQLGLEPSGVTLSHCRKHLMWFCQGCMPETFATAAIELTDQGFETWSCEAGSPRRRKPDSTSRQTLGTTVLRQD